MNEARKKGKKERYSQIELTKRTSRLTGFYSNPITNHPFSQRAANMCNGLLFSSSPCDFSRNVAVRYSTNTWTYHHFICGFKCHMWMAMRTRPIHGALDVCEWVSNDVYEFLIKRGKKMKGTKKKKEAKLYVRLAHLILIGSLEAFTIPNWMECA